MEIKYVLRDEKVNILSMTNGGVDGNYSHQFILCKKKPFTNGKTGPFLLDAKKTKPLYRLSQKGMIYHDETRGFKCDLTHVAFVDSQIKVRVSRELFEIISESGFFSIWDPDAPANYFNGHNQGYLVLLRVYRLEEAIPEKLLEKGRQGRNYIFSLSQPFETNISNPVIEVETFQRMKSELTTIIQLKEWLIERIDLAYDKPQVKIFSKEYLLMSEHDSYLINKQMNLLDLEKKIRNKKIVNDMILVDSTQFYRDPDIGSYALIRANGVCECCKRMAPFKRQDGSPFIESHHIVPLSKNGRDSIQNICAVCPNCHRELHFGEYRESLARALQENIHKKNS